MATRRFRVEDVSPPSITVGGEEAVHALRVLRLGVGSEVVLFDGRGGEVQGTIRRADRTQFEVEVTRREEIDRGEASSLVLAVATPKGRRGDWLVEKCAEFGVRALWPLRTRRGEVEPGEAKLDRWRRKAIEAAKQSRQSVAMTIEPTRALSDLRGAVAGRCLFVGDAAGSKETFSEALSGLPPAGPGGREILMVVGPEGGFTASEQADLGAIGCRAVGLGGTILRVETAAIAAAAVWASWAAGGEK